MLTRKQKWRRTRERVSNPLMLALIAPRIESCSATSNIDVVEQIPTKNESKRMVVVPPVPPVRLKSALSSSNLLGLVDKRIRGLRSLRFSPTVHVLLIPSRIELLSNFDNVYWLHDDYVSFKRDAVKEIREAARMHNLPAKAAMTLLYQPEKPEICNDDIDNLFCEEEQHDYDYYSGDCVTLDEYPEQNVTIDYQYHCSNHPLPMARKDSNFLLDQQASPHSITMSSPKSTRDLKFITNAKTDLEINSSKVDEKAEGTRKIVQPRRTTTDSPQKQHAWAVQWKKKST